MPNRHVADIVILSCAISAGIHAALVPEHFDEGIGPGTGFVLSAVLLVALAVLLTRRPSTLGLAAAVAVFAGLLAAYALAVEALGLVGALVALGRPSLLHWQLKGARP